MGSAVASSEVRYCYRRLNVNPLPSLVEHIHLVMFSGGSKDAQSIVSLEPIEEETGRTPNCLVGGHCRSTHDQ